MANQCLQIATLPLRLLTYSFVMLLLTGLFLPITFLRALYRRFFVGKATDIQHPKNPINGPSQGYACQIVLKKSIQERERFVEVVRQLAKECSIDEKFVQVRYETEKPFGDFPTKSSIPGDHYVAKGESFVETADVMGMGMAKNLAILIRVWNNDEGKPTVLHCGLPGAHWDGTSCFNFTKEMLHRYVTKNKKDYNNIYKHGELKINAQVKKSLDNSSFWKFLFVQQPYAVLFNSHAMAWRLATSPPCWGGDGFFDIHVELLNLDEKLSKEFADASKKLGYKPFAALVHSAVTAHNTVMSHRARRVIMQASMQSRAYEPIIKERNIIGDWLVGPVQRLDTSIEYTLEKSQEEYDNLIKEMTFYPSEGEVAQTFNAKAYGLQNHGAAGWEWLPCYGYDTGLTGPSVFFNNYGIRQMNQDAGVLTWNWVAPFYLGCNCVNVNGRTNIGFATAFIGGKNLTAIRNQMEINVKKLIARAAAI